VFGFGRSRRDNADGAEFLSRSRHPLHIGEVIPTGYARNCESALQSLVPPLHIVLVMAHGKPLTGKEVALHNSRESCWVIVHGKLNCTF